MTQADESHRSIYKKYQDIFEYFDGMLLGMTATPKEEIDRNTYSTFNQERGVPTFAYELDQAVAEGYLVDYMRIVMQTAEQLSGLYTIPQVRAQRVLIERARTEDFWEHAAIFDMEQVREALRDLLKFIERRQTNIYYTDFEDGMIEEKEGEAIYFSNDLQNYKKKVEYYLKEHKDHLAVYKLRHNKRLTSGEFAEVERILWEELLPHFSRKIYRWHSRS